MAKQSDRPKIKRVYNAPSDTHGTHILVERMWLRDLNKERVAVALRL
jgi:uncharacterized protein YeaO (DUF488 family)